MSSPSFGGIGGRWTLGIVIIVHVIVYNECSGSTVVLAALVSTACALLSAACQQSLAHVQLPYMRATHRFDFFCQFIALWMDILALLACCAALARTLSTCMDAMSGGMARIYLLGRNSPDNEPWPDVLGVSVVFLLTVMFMLGLENTRVFGLLMTVGVLGLTIVLSVLCTLRGRFDVWKVDGGGMVLPHQNVSDLMTSAALFTIAYPSGVATSALYRRCLRVVHMLLVGVSIAFTAGCLSTITQLSKQPQPYVAVPILPLLERLDFHTLQPAVACLLVLACSGAYLELFPAMYGLIVRLTTAEWKILPRQIGYESTDSGSPVLAIFTGASLCAMLAFACPLQNLVYMLAGAHLAGGLVRAVYLLYAPLRPKFVVASTNDASLAYSRLDVNAKPPASSASSHHHHHHHHPTSASASATRSSSLWSFLRKPARSMSMLPTTAVTKAMLKKKKKSKRDEELEREWLLLGEPPQSPRLGGGVASGLPDNTTECVESIIVGGSSAVAAHHRSADIERIDVLGDEQQQGHGAECAGGVTGGCESDTGSESGSSSSTTDIDAIVDEYRQKVKVSTAGPMEKIVRLPTLGTWRIANILMAVLAVALLLAAVSAVRNEYVLLLCGGGTALAIALPLAVLPRYAHGPATPSALTCCLALLLHAVLLAPALTGCWPAILFWALAGAMLFVRCDRWCCACFDQPRLHAQLHRPRGFRRSSGRHQHSMLLLPNVAATATSASSLTASGQMASIRMPCPPRGSMVSSRIAGHR